MANKLLQEELTSIAQDYYLSHLSMSEIAKKHQISRYYVEKYLLEAVSTGLVTISIKTPTRRNRPLELKFLKQFNLKNLYIIQDSANPNDNAIQTTDYASEQIQQLIHGCKVVGLSWGSRIYEIIQHFQPEIQQDLIFTQFVGENMKYHSQAGSTRMVETAANKFMASYQTMVGPLYIFNQNLLTQYKKEPTISPTIQTAKKMDLLISALGTISSIDSVPVWSENRSKIIPDGKEKEVAGVIFGRAFNVKGEFLFPETPVLGLSLSDILSVPRRFGIVTSKFKTEATFGALRGGFFTDLVISESVANRIIYSFPKYF